MPMDPDHWRDTHVRVRGPVVRGMQGAFAEHWLEAHRARCSPATTTCPTSSPSTAAGAMQLVRSSAKVGDTNAEALYYLAIASAQRSIDLTAAYFVPAPRVHRGALRRRPSAGVEVRILVPGPAHRQGIRPGRRRAAYAELLEAGVEDVRVPADDAAREVARASTAAGPRSGRSTSTTARSSSTTRSRSASGTSRFADELDAAFEHDLERSRARSRPDRWSGRGPPQRAGRGGHARCCAASCEPTDAAILPRSSDRPVSPATPFLLAGRALERRTPSSRRSATPTRRCCARCARAGTPSRSRRREGARDGRRVRGASGSAIGAVGASIDERRRGAVAGRRAPSGPAAIGVNYASSSRSAASGR